MSAIGRLAGGVFTLAVMALSSAACAQQLSQPRIQLTPLPSVLSVNTSMGVLDRRGYGGYAPPNTSASPVTIVSETNNATSLASTDLVIDGWGQLVFTGTYGNTLASGTPITPPTGTCTLPSPTAGYTVKVSDGAITTTICVSILANTAFARAHWVSPGYTLANYTLTNPDSAGRFQLATYIADTTFPLDGTILLRDGSGTTGLTPALSAWYWNLASGNLPAASVPGTAGALASYKFADGTGAAQVTDSGSSGSTLAWTTMVAHTGTGLSASKTYNAVGPGIAYGTTASGCTAGTGSGSCTLSQALLPTFVAGENVVLSGQPIISSEHPTTGNDLYGNPIWGGAAQVAALRLNTATDFYNPWLLENVTFYNDVPAGGNVALFCGYLTSFGTTAAGGAVLTVVPTVVGVSPANCVQSVSSKAGSPRGVLAVGQAMTTVYNLVNAGQAAGTYIAADATTALPGVTLATACNGSPCTGTDNPNPASPETYFVDSANLIHILQTSGSAGTPIQLASGLYGSFGGQPGNGVNTNYAFQNGQGYGLTLLNNRFENGPDISDTQLSLNSMLPLGFTNANVVNNAFNRTESAIVTGLFSYGQYSGAQAAACTGPVATQTCVQAHIWGNVVQNNLADFIDLSGNTGNIDFEFNLLDNERSDIGNQIPANQDQFTIKGTAGPTSKTYTFVNSITGACVTSPTISGNCDGNILISPTNQAVNNLRELCTINAAHSGAYVQIAPFFPTFSNSTLPIGLAAYQCVDGVDLPLAETADPTVVATYDSVNSFVNYEIPLMATNPADTVSTSWFSQQYSESNGATSTTDTATLAQFTATYGSDLNVTALSQGQVVIGAVLTNVSGGTVPANTRVLSFVPGTTPGGLGHYTLSAAITCSGCSLKEALTATPVLSQGTLHPDCLQPDLLSTAGGALVPFTYSYNICVKGGNSNYWGNQGQTFFPTVCCYVMNQTNNLWFQTFTNGIVMAMYQNSTVAYNMTVQDVASNYFDQTGANYNAILGLTMNGPSYNPALYHMVMETSCPTAGSTGNVVKDNIANEIDLTCGSFTLTPSNQETLNWNSSQEIASNVALRYGTIFPNYPTALNTGTGGCGGNRAGLIRCATPARGVIFSGSLTTSCTLTSTTLLTLNTKVNDGATAFPAVGLTAYEFSVASVSGPVGGVYTYTFYNMPGSCTAAGPQNFATGAENPDGTYNGPVFPLDNASVASWNDGTIFNPAATHSPATDAGDVFDRWDALPGNDNEERWAA